MKAFDLEHSSEMRTETSTDPERDEARKRLEERRGFTSNVAFYIVVNAFLILVWAFTGGGYFWPGWVMGGWGVALILSHLNRRYLRRPITDADVDAELESKRR